MQKSFGFKSQRMLEIYVRLQQGDVLKKAQLAQEYEVNQRSIQRDVEDLRNFLAERHSTQLILNDKDAGGYRLVDRDEMKFTNKESLAAIKILLESRSLTRQEMFPILEKLLLNCVPKDQVATIQRLIANEQHYYIEPHHGKEVLSTLWELGEAVTQQQRIRIAYTRMKDTESVSRTVEPVGIMFSEYYFYLIAFIADERIRSKLKEKHKEQYPAIYRLDRISSLERLPEYFRVPYLDRFQEGEFRKRVQFMYGGDLRTVKFRYSGQSVEAVLDRLPTAEILEKDEKGWVIQAEVFGDGIEMWMRSQGEFIKPIN